MRPVRTGMADDAVLKTMAADLVEGFALLDDRSRFLWVNDAGGQILGECPARLVGRVSPFRTAVVGASRNRGRDATEVHTTTARTRHGELDLEYRLLDTAGSRRAVAFRDTTGLRRLAAIARAASSVADSGRLDLTLTALADAVYAAGRLAAVQVVTLHENRPLLRVVGRAGFVDGDDYTDRLEECRRRGAEMQMLQAAREQRPVVTHHRKASVMADPRWAPMHEFFGPVAWDAFAAVPLVVRKQTVGMLVVFYPPGRHPDDSSLSFLTAMADQAATAVDHASLLSESRDRVRREERQRIARELHDSVVQHVFSMRLQARALHDHCRASDEEAGLDPQRVTSGVAALMTLAEHALADLRDLIFELRPGDIVDVGLVEAIRVHAGAIRSRSGLAIEVDSSQAPTKLGPDVQHDVYRIVQEALHNVVEHTDAKTATVRIDMESADHQHVVVEVMDDGNTLVRGFPREGEAVLSPMRERVARWGGDLRVDLVPGGGSRVRVALPLPPPVAPTTAAVGDGR